MISYTRIRINVASNGAFKANAVMTKDERGAFRIISDNDVFGAGSHSTAPLFGRALFVTELPVTDDGMHDGFVTECLVLGELNPFSRYTFSVVGDDAVWNDGDAVLDYASLFEEQSRMRASISGVAVKEGYAQTATYSGMNGYHHYSHTNYNAPLTTDKPWKIGIELEVYGRTRSAFETITGARSNWFQCERDGSLTESSFGVEIKTIPLLACDAKSVDFWHEPMARLKQLAVSKDRHTTGLHVHIGKEILGSTDAERRRTIDKLTFFYYYLVEDIPENHAKNVTICGRERGYGADPGFGKTELSEFAKTIGFDAVTKNGAAFTQMAGGIRNVVEGGRHDINLAHLNGYGTIEFRKGKGAISKTRMVGLVTWWEQMCLYCRETPADQLSFDAFFEKVTRENPCVAYFFQGDEEC